MRSAALNLKTEGFGAQAVKLLFQTCFWSVLSATISPIIVDE